MCNKNFFLKSPADYCVDPCSVYFTSDMVKHVRHMFPEPKKNQLDIK